MLVSTPPMGWNSWNTFGERINEQIVMETADAMVEQGYLRAGYQYLVIDDCWSERRRGADGRLHEDKQKFPHGMKALSDYVHGKGLKFGMYSCAGVMTCAGYPSSYDHEFVDAQTFADWGVDYLKYDYCHFPKGANGRIRYQTMAMALRATGRDILFAACNWGSEESYKWMRSAGAHTFRSTGDIFDAFSSAHGIVQSQLPLLYANTPQCFNDMDMLTVGMYASGNVVYAHDGTATKPQTDTEYDTQFMLWCACASPLIIGGDIRHMNDHCKALLQNPRLIAVNQDAECRPPFVASQDGARTVFLRHLSGGEVLLGFVNGEDREYTLSCYLADVGLPSTSGVSLRLTDVYTGEDAGVAEDYLRVSLPAHGARLLRGALCKTEG